MSTFSFTPMQTTEARAELFRLGHFHVAFDGHADAVTVNRLDAQSREFQQAVHSFQQYSDLLPDGKLGNETLTVLSTRFHPAGGFRCCGRPDIEPAVEEANIPNGTQTWPQPDQPIVMAYDFEKLPGLTAEQTKAAYEKALSDINSNIGVRLQLGKWSQAHVQVRLKGLGGGTLAIALLSMGTRKIGGHFQNYDSSNRTWNSDLAQEVICHETLHTLGFSHSRDSGAIMYPTASGRKIVMQRDDIQRGKSAYGPSFGDQVPDTPDTPKIPEGEQSFSGLVQIGGKAIQLSGKATVIG